MNIKTNVIVSLFCLGAASVSAAAEFEDTARVLSATPQYEQINQPHQECRTEYVPVQQQKQRGLAGVLIGGAAGGILGNQVGKGNGRTAATAIGAVTGAIVGDRIENSGNNESTTSEQAVRNCRTVDRWETRANGYAVTYEYRGRQYTSVMPNDPGERLRLHVSLTPRP